MHYQAAQRRVSPSLVCRARFCLAMAETLRLVLPARMGQFTLKKAAVAGGDAWQTRYQLPNLS